MNVDFDIKQQAKLKKGTLLIHDGKAFVPTTKEELLKDELERIKKLETLYAQVLEHVKQEQNNTQEKINRFLGALGGIK